MSTLRYREQALLLLDVLPEVAKEERFALHGGTAINLFVRDMPRLSVDLDLTYLPIEERSISLSNIARTLQSVQDRLTKNHPTIRTRQSADHAKVFCTRQGVQVKIEVNTVMRGAMGEPIVLTLSNRTQETFNRFAEMRIVSIGQLYGGKICAALDRQHPRDLFDIKHMLSDYGFSDEIRKGFLLGLLSTDRPIHEVIRPTLLDQRHLHENHFAGMSEEPFGYEDFEEARSDLISTIHARLDGSDRRLLKCFAEGEPERSATNFGEFAQFPAVQWKLRNIRNLRSSNPAKYREQVSALAQALGFEDE